MYKLKKFLPILLLVAMLLLAGPAYAQARYGTQMSAAVETSTALLLPAGTWIYGMTIYADSAANAFMGVYDSATLGGCTNDTVKGETGEPTQYESTYTPLPGPVFCKNGVSVVITVGVGWVHYGPEPD